MGIEDVDYLKKHSVKQSYVFMTDSADRDRRSYPTPSEYVMEFTQPFQKVVGLEVLDASIPRTMYNVDVINNQVAFFIHDDTFETSNASAPSRCVTANISPGEYTIQTLVPALNRVLSMRVNGDSNLPIASIVAETTTNPPDVESKVRFRCPYPFYLNMDSTVSTMAETLGFDTHVDATEASVPELQRRYEAPIPDQVKLYHSVDIAPEIAMGAERILFQGPRGVIRNVPISTSQYAAQRFVPPANCYFTQCFVALTTTNVSTNSGATWELRRGTAEAPDMTSEGRLANGIVAVSYVDGTLSDSTPTTIRQLLIAEEYYWIVLTSDGDDLNVYYNDDLNTETTFRTSTNGTTWTSIDADDIYYQLSMNIIAKDEYHLLTAPGLYSLVGPRYIVLRCPEIEENSFRSLAYGKHHLGLAKFRLGVVGYSENRLDFSKVPTREFHPIGKLSRLTLRFELSDGRLYDFKGVNHTITFAIHYYEPTSQNMFQQSILNPNYDGNFLEYMYRQEQQESDSDDQEEDFSRDRLRDYRIQEVLHHPETQRRRDLERLFDEEMLENEEWA